MNRPRLTLPTLSRPELQRPTRDQLRAAGLATVPVLVLWSPMLVWFAAFKPGIMTNDSIDVWGQVLSGRWVDWHPPVYTALQWVSFQLVSSPALATLAQSLALAWAMSRLLKVGIRLGLPAVPVWIAGALLALTPPVGAFSVHLWKDVPYAVALLLVVTLFLQSALGRVGLSDAPRLAQYVLGALGVVGLVLLRQNGIIVALATAVAITVLAPRRWVAAAMWCSAIGVALMVQTVLYPLMGVEEPSPRFQVGLAPFDLGYLAVEHPDELDAEQLQLVDDLAPLERWRRDFDCHWTGTRLSELKPSERIAPIRDELNAAWRDVVLTSPWQVGQGHLCAASVAWNPVPSAAERVRFEYLYTGIIDNDLGLTTSPLVDPLETAGRDVLKRSMTANWQPWLWRAPTWIYLCILIAAVVSWRRRSLWTLVAMAPLVAQQVSVIVMTGPHARYMLPAGIAAVCMLPALGRAAWLPPAETSDAPPEPADPDGPAAPDGEQPVVKSDSGGRVASPRSTVDRSRTQ